MKLIALLLLSSSMVLAQTAPEAKAPAPAKAAQAAPAKPEIVPITDTEKLALLKANNITLQALLTLQQSAEYMNFISTQNNLQGLIKKTKSKYECKELTPDFDCTK